MKFQHEKGKPSMAFMRHFKMTRLSWDPGYVYFILLFYLVFASMAPVAGKNHCLTVDYSVVPSFANYQQKNECAWNDLVFYPPPIPQPPF
jgi:hypothetical protein